MGAVLTATDCITFCMYRLSAAETCLTSGLCRASRVVDMLTSAMCKMDASNLERVRNGNKTIGGEAKNQQRFQDGGRHHYILNAVAEPIISTSDTLNG